MKVIIKLIQEGASARLYEGVFVDGKLYIGEHGRPGRHAPSLDLGSEFGDYLKREDAKGAVGLEIEVELKKAGEEDDESVVEGDLALKHKGSIFSITSTPGAVVTNDMALKKVDANEVVRVALDYPLNDSSPDFDLKHLVDYFKTQSNPSLFKEWDPKREYSTRQPPYILPMVMASKNPFIQTTIHEVPSSLSLPLPMAPPGYTDPEKAYLPYIPPTEPPVLPTRPWVHKKRTHFSLGLITGLTLSAITVVAWALSRPDSCPAAVESPHHANDVPLEICQYFKSRYGLKMNDWNKATQAQIRSCMWQDPELEVEKGVNEVPVGKEDELGVELEIEQLLKQANGKKQERRWWSGEVGEVHNEKRQAHAPDTSHKPSNPPQNTTNPVIIIAPEPDDDSDEANYMPIIHRRHPTHDPQNTTNHVIVIAPDGTETSFNLHKRWKITPNESERCWKQNRTAMLLALFLGTLGIDQWYAGHWALAVFKMFTLGGAGLWSLIDMVLWITGVYEVSGCGGHTWRY